MPSPPEVKQLCFLIFESNLVWILFYTSWGGVGGGGGFEQRCLSFIIL
jgi:hypothetical protein